MTTTKPRTARAPQNRSQRRAVRTEMNGKKAPTFCFFTCAVEVYFKDGEQEKSRKLNILLKTDTPQISKSTLGNIQNAAIERWVEMTKGERANILDVVILAMLPMMQGTEEMFDA